MRSSRLPEIVPQHEGAKLYSAADNGDVRRLAWALRQLTGAVAGAVAAAISEKRVMFPPLLYRAIAWVAVKRGMPELEFWMRAYRHPKHGARLTAWLLRDAATWAVSGTDREDRDSVGGFSQREVNFLAGLIHVAQRAVDRSMVTA